MVYFGIPKYHLVQGKNPVMAFNPFGFSPVTYRSPTRSNLTYCVANNVGDDRLDCLLGAPVWILLRLVGLVILSAGLFVPFPRLGPHVLQQEFHVHCSFWAIK